MAITSVGYPNSIDPSINAEDWALFQGALGEKYWVSDAAAANVTVVGSAARTVRVAPGRIGGGGVMDTIDDALGPNDIVLPEPGSGTVYYTIVARRVWQTTNATTLTYVTGTADRAIAATRNADPGTIDDHPLALVAVTAGNPTPSISADLRAIGNAKGRYEAYDDLVLGYMDEPGYTVRVNGVDWLRLADGTWKTNPWANVTSPDASPTAMTGWAVWNVGVPTQTFKLGPIRWLRYSVRRVGDPMSLGAQDFQFGLVGNTDFRPTYSLTGAAKLWVGDEQSATIGGTAELRPSGEVWMIDTNSTSGAFDLRYAIQGQTSIYADFVFVKP